MLPQKNLEPKHLGLPNDFKHSSCSPTVEVVWTIEAELTFDLIFLFFTNAGHLLHIFPAQQALQLSATILLFLFEIWLLDHFISLSNPQLK